MTTFILLLFLANSEVARFETTQALCMETLQAHRQGAIVYSWDAGGKQWPAENVFCVEIETIEQEDAIS